MKIQYSRQLFEIATAAFAAEEIHRDRQDGQDKEVMSDK
jgi:hypothetical protein